ncbi:GntR family transcriptional regulator [Celeribacter sp.]|uniref:GntR family transcriptional regulator n=1 Tax=Celeribacter sp. TaxID=1890673 RepID=UPI003A951FCF
MSPQLVAYLRDRIVRSDLVPGTRLSEVEIATHYSTSRQPVREAFIKLSEAGLIDIRPQRGSFVSRIDIASVLAAQFVREAVEADIVRAAAVRITDAQALELDANLAAQRKAVDGDPQVFMELDETFHRTIANIAGQGAGWGFLETLRIQMDRVRHLSASQFPRKILLEQHTEIANAIKDGDAVVAERKMRQHLRRVLNDIPVVASANPDFFIAEDA